MESLSLEQASYLAEIIGVIAVVISLIYVALQLKQNTQAIKQGSVKNIINTLRDATANLGQSEEKTEILLQLSQNTPELTMTQKVRSYVMLQNLMSAFELAYFEQSQGALEEEHWSGYQQFLVDICKAPGIREYWKARCTWYRKDFRAYMDEVILPRPASTGFKLIGT